MPTPCDGVELGGICIQTFQPFKGFASMGLISTLAQLFNLMFLILFIMWIMTLIIAVLNYLRSEGKEDVMMSGRTAVENVFRGISVGLAGFIIVSALGLILGAGLPFSWPDNFAQCGGERELYMDAKERLFTSVLFAAGTSVEIYCCRENPVDDGAWEFGAPPPGIADYCQLFKTETIP